jgi:hypothetical protein
MKTFRITIKPVESQPTMTISFYINGEDEDEVLMGLNQNFHEFHCVVNEVIIQNSFSQARKNSGL